MATLRVLKKKSMEVVVRSLKMEKDEAYVEPRWFCDQMGKNESPEPILSLLMRTGAGSLAVYSSIAFLKSICSADLSVPATNISRRL